MSVLSARLLDDRLAPVDPRTNNGPYELVERIETSDQLAISAISCWELAMLVRRGRVQVSLPLDRWMTQRSAVPA